MFEPIGGRKLAFGVLILGIGLVVGFSKGDIPSNVLSLLEFVFASFVAGNSVGTVAGAISGRKQTNDSPSEDTDLFEEPSTSTIDLTPVTNAVEELKVADAELAQSMSIVQQSLSMIIRRTGIDRMPEPPNGSGA